MNAALAHLKSQIDWNRRDIDLHIDVLKDASKRAAEAGERIAALTKVEGELLSAIATLEAAEVSS